MREAAAFGPRPMREAPGSAGCLPAQPSPGACCRPEEAEGGLGSTGGPGPPASFPSFAPLPGGGRPAVGRPAAVGHGPSACKAKAGPSPLTAGNSVPSLAMEVLGAAHS